ncbi:MAG TPA: ammonium transporter [Verrucomicrobiae bacterium]|nr:ammonium transporter [Verrucomicrobiae bacterium]
MRVSNYRVPAALGLLLFPIFSWAQAAPGVPAVADTGDTAWLISATALVLFMTLPGLALFYAGLVRSKNVLSILIQCFTITCVVSLLWLAVGYSLTFSDGGNAQGWIGGLDKAFLAGVTRASVTGTVPESVFFMFQMTFAVITPALVIGGFAERMRFSAVLLFSVLWSLLVYVPIAHWVWGGGWLAKLGVMDYAGGIVVHVSAGVAALVCAVVLGKRRGFPHTAMTPHSLPFTVAGGGMLWVGWFGFNAGSALAANGLAGHAFVTTNTATAAAALAWMFTEWASRGKPTVLGAASGAVAGLVAVTPAAGFVTPMASIAIGAVAGVICYTACNLKAKIGYDDSLDVVGVHGVGGTWGALATGIFATKLVNDAGGDGLLYGNPKQLVIQIMAVGVTLVLGFVMTTVILKVLDAVMGLRVSEEDEMAGLDLSQHSETAYALGGGGEYSVSGGAFEEAMRATQAKARAAH